MKTYIICTSPQGKAAADYFFLLAKTITENGNRVIVITDGNKPERLPPDTGQMSFLSWPSKRPVKLKDFIFFYKVCRKFRPDVTLGQFGSANVVAVISWLAGVKNIFCYWHTKAEQLLLDNKHNFIKFKYQVWRKKAVLNFFFTKILTNSEENKKSLTHFFSVKKEKAFMMPLLIADFYEEEKNMQDKPGRDKISFVARLDKSKGHETIMQELRSIVMDYSSIKIYFVGDGPEKEKLQKMAAQLNISDNIIFTGAVALQEVHRYMLSSLVHISASIDEAFGLVNIEALCAGTPVLAPQAGGIKEILEDGYNGFFYSPAMNGDLYKKLKYILDGNWQQYSENARRSFLQNFAASKENMQKHAAMLEQIME